MERLKGFTLMELMIVIAIVGILVAISIPSYQTYTRRARYTEIIQAAAPYKAGVEECFQTTGELDDCQAGKHHIPKAVEIQESRGLVGSISVLGKGYIEIKPQKKYGIKPEDTYELIPEIEKGQLNWKTSGGALAAGYAH